MKTATRTIWWMGLLFLITVTVAAGHPPAGLADSSEWITIDFPGATDCLTFGINSRGEITGAYSTDGIWYHSFLLDRRGFKTLLPSFSTDDYAVDINDSGAIVGMYQNADDLYYHGYLLEKGVFTKIDPPGGAVFTEPAGINNRGEIVGRYSTDGPAYHGFYYYKGVFETIDLPGATTTILAEINASGDIVGDYTLDGVDHGLLLSKGTITRVDFPGAKSTWALGISDPGEIVGTYIDADDMTHGFLVSKDVKRGKGTFRTIDPPGSIFTWAVSINSAGDIVGFYLDGAYKYHGFLLKGGK